MEPEARQVSPLSAGLRSRCPRCGEGALFDGYLRLASACGACELDYGPADSGDGPAVFVMFLVGAVVVPIALGMELAGLPLWLTFGVTLPLAAGLTLALLRPFKSTLIALQYHHKAAEARLDQ
ncbi:MAG: DUF983 domain-containing protein [Caulobacterales bacterium]|nr:DUF983 domain-containing protein [Caulobacterales bacterium]